MKKRRPWGLWAFAVFMVVAGLNHFRAPEFYIGIMPPWLPANAALVFWSGVAEVVAGVGVLIPRIRREAGWFAIAVLLGVFPANLWMALDPTIWPELPTWSRWARLPFQALFIGWAWVVTQPSAADG